MLSAVELADCTPHTLDFAGRASWRVRVVSELVEINSRQLRVETRRAGADIELQGALERTPDAALPTGMDLLREALAAAEAELDALELRRSALLAVLDALNAAELAGGQP